MTTEWYLGTGQQMLRATVERVLSTGVVVVSDPDGILEHEACDLLETGQSGCLKLATNDKVFVWHPGPESENRPIILGRVGAANPAATPQGECPSQLVLEAKEHLSLKCGEGSISIRADGKVLIQGKDLVSRALCTNRIKGGAVSIN